MIHEDFVLTIHASLLNQEAGLKGTVDLAKLQGALGRIEHWITHEHLNDIFEIAALYAVAIAKAHAFSDGNKRTALVTMLCYLDLQGIEIQENSGLDERMVEVASGQLDFKALAEWLKAHVA